MAYTYKIRQVLNEYDEQLYKMIEIKIISSDQPFRYKAKTLMVVVKDSANAVYGKLIKLSGNQKEQLSYFAVNAFASLSSPISIVFGFVGEEVHTFSNVNIQNIDPLGPTLAAVSHQVADITWFQNL
jgi:hypothetical protein